MIESDDDWSERMLRPCHECPHRLITHNAPEHPSAPDACRACACPAYRATPRPGPKRTYPAGTLRDTNWDTTSARRATR